MKLPSLKDSSTPDELLVGLDAYISEAGALLDEKNMIDLAGLDAVVDVLCARILKLSEADRVGYADKLDELGARLSILQKQMVATQETLKKELETASARQKASKAYRQDGN